LSVRCKPGRRDERSCRGDQNELLVHDLPLPSTSCVAMSLSRKAWPGSSCVWRPDDGWLSLWSGLTTEPISALPNSQREENEPGTMGECHASTRVCIEGRA
jgi:hypothetical protein